VVEVFDRVLQAARQLGASDVLLKAGQPPIFRIKGELRTIQNVPPLSRDVIATFAHNIMSPRQREEFETKFECDLAYSTPDGVRYRINAFHQRGNVGMVLRVIPPDVPPFETLGLPPVVLKLAEEPRGLVLVTGVTGSGKSTTIAAMIDHVNSRRAGHIVTVEDPIEYVFTDKRCVVTQREVGLDTLSFSRALRAALRQNPDVVLVGEMRDVETCEIALIAAETGHMVLSTLHTVDAVETINRVIGIFPPHQQAHVRLQMAAILRGIISQRLVPRADGNGMIPAVEVLVGTGRVRELIEDAQRTSELRDAIAQGREPYGMVSFDQSLTELVQKKLVTYADAVRFSTNPDDFALYFRGVSQSTDVDWNKPKRTAPPPPAQPAAPKAAAKPEPPQPPGRKAVPGTPEPAAPGEAEGWMERFQK
jgi:twitching motility protein PilT